MTEALIKAVETAALAFAKKRNADATYEFLRTRDGRKAASAIRAIIEQASKNPAYVRLMETNREAVISELGMHYATCPGSDQ